jgi:ribosomal protein L34
MVGAGFGHRVCTVYGRACILSRMQVRGQSRESRARPECGVSGSQAQRSCGMCVELSTSAGRDVVRAKHARMELAQSGLCSRT